MIHREICHTFPSKMQNASIAKSNSIKVTAWGQTCRSTAQVGGQETSKLETKSSVELGAQRPQIPIQTKLGLMTIGFLEFQPKAV